MKIKECNHLKKDKNLDYIKVVYSDRELHYCIECFKNYSFIDSKYVCYVEKDNNRKGK